MAALEAPRPWASMLERLPAQEEMTDAPLLTTKVHIPPPLPNLVARPRLLQLLDDGLRLGHRLSLISAPAGMGKTTLVSEWIHHLQRPASMPASAAPPVGASQNPQPEAQIRAAWLSLEDRDQDPKRFWTYLVATLQSVEAELGWQTLELLQSPQLPMAATLLTPLLNDIAVLAGSLGSKILVLVLDDYHTIANPAIHEGVGFLIEHQPANMHLVISTRADPPLPIFRLRARGQLTELRQENLRFSSAEALAFLNAGMGLDLTAGEVASLQARTEGWIVGLQLAALSLQGRQDKAAFITAFTGSHHYVLEYLSEEVVRRQPAAVRNFLIQTSILDRLCGPLCDAVLGEGGRTEGAGTGPLDDRDLLSATSHSPASQEMLSFLQHQNLFVVPLDDQHRWYRYHHLFADLLANLLRQERPVQRITELHRRASVWYEENGYQDDAIRHALEARAFERAAALIEKAAPAALAQGQLLALLRWQEALPDGVVGSRPQLRLYQAWALHLSGHSTRAEQLLRDAKRTLRARPPSLENEVLRGKVAALLTGIVSVHGGALETIEQAEEALGCLPEDDLASRARVQVALGTAYAYQDAVDAAQQAWQHAIELALVAGNPFLAASAIELQAGMQIYNMGRLREGVRILRQAFDLGTAPDGSLLPFTATAHALLAEVELEWNNLDAAGAYLEKAIELQRRAGIAYGLTHTYCARARLARAKGDRQAVIDALQMAQQAVESLPMWHIILHLAACQTRLRLWLGDVASATRWAEADSATIEHNLPEDLPHNLRELLQLSQARVHLAQGHAIRAIQTAGMLLPGAESAGRMAHVVEGRLLMALALQAEGQTSAALDALEGSLVHAEREGYVRLYLEAGEPLRALVSELRASLRARADGRKPEDPQRLLPYCDRLLAAFAGAGSMPALPAADKVPRRRPPVEPLTRREQEVLQLVCEGLSNREIAERLTVTLNTVKKHTSNIYGKLAVKSRTQAIVQARELGLC